MITGLPVRWTHTRSRECLYSGRNPLEEILHAIFPEELLEGSPTGFSTMGHLGRPYSHLVDLCLLGLTVMPFSSFEPQRRISAIQVHHRAGYS